MKTGDDMMGRLERARLVSSVDLTDDLEDIDRWRSVRPIHLALVLFPVAGLVGFLLYRYRLWLRRLARLAGRLRRLGRTLERVAGIAVRLAEVAGQKE